MSQPESMKTPCYSYGVDVLNGDDAWELFVACAVGDRETVEALLAHDPRLVNAQFWYQFPIHRAVACGNTELVELLLDKGANPGLSRFTYDSWDKLLRTANERNFLHVTTILEQAMAERFAYHVDFHLLKDAIVSRDWNRVESVLQNQPFLVNHADTLGNNPLHWCVITRQPTWLRRFAKLGTQVKSLRADGHSPALLAASHAQDYWYRETRGRRHPSLRNSWVMVGQLLELGAEYELSVAAAIGDLERVNGLLASTPALANQLNSASVSPLAYASGEGYQHIVECLLEAGADPNQPEVCAPRGLALFEACSQNHFDIARLLLDQGADPNAEVDSCGCCLTIAELKHGGQAERLIALLRDHGARTPMYALSVDDLRRHVTEISPVVDDPDFFESLLRCGDGSLIDAYLKCKGRPEGRLSLSEIPKGEQRQRIVQQLLDAGYDLNQTDWLGVSHLHEMVADADLSTIEILLHAGADINVLDADRCESPLALAVRTVHNAVDSDVTSGLEIVKCLLSAGADPGFPTDRPEASAIGIARRLKVESVRELFGLEQFDGAGGAD